MFARECVALNGKAYHSPRIKHYGCENCHFLGNYRYDGTDYDLYFCTVESKYPTVYAFFGTPNQSDFVCSSVNNRTDIASYEVLFQARRRARWQGLF